MSISQSPVLLNNSTTHNYSVLSCSMSIPVTCTTEQYNTQLLCSQLLHVNTSVTCTTEQQYNTQLLCSQLLHVNISVTCTTEQQYNTQLLCSQLLHVNTCHLYY